MSSWLGNIDFHTILYWNNTHRSKLIVCFISLYKQVSDEKGVSLLTQGLWQLLTLDTPPDFFVSLKCKNNKIFYLTLLPLLRLSAIMGQSQFGFTFVNMQIGSNMRMLFFSGVVKSKVIQELVKFKLSSLIYIRKIR